MGVGDVCSEGGLSSRGDYGLSLNWTDSDSEALGSVCCINDGIQQFWLAARRTIRNWQFLCDAKKPRDRGGLGIADRIASSGWTES